MKSKSRKRLHIRINGAVQGVGFRPFVHQLAIEFELGGWVRNSSYGVELEIEGSHASCQNFVARLRSHSPPLANLRKLDVSLAEIINECEFSIRASEQETEPILTEILPDIATCSACLAELSDPKNRRFEYPFINCLHCGPRYSIVLGTPYDRCRTTMQAFTMCDACHSEYVNPANRRFHAQPNACPTCGPRVDYQDADGVSQAEGADALDLATEAIGEGKIVAIKGLGGFHLFADAGNEVAVRQLRERKQREAKPFALMYSSLAAISKDCHLSDLESELLGSSAAPIVLLRRRPSSHLPSGIAPENPYLGAMLPCTPLHHLLMRQLGRPAIATSGNLAEEPICIDNDEARQRLGKIADGFLMHDRPIQRAVDDSVVCVVAGREMMLRRSRGYSPAPIEIHQESPPVLAMGGDLKNTIALTNNGQAFLSQHIGDLSNACAHNSFDRHRIDLPLLFCSQPTLIAVDHHPDYHSARVSIETNLPVIEVQHHHAHVASCLADNGLNQEVLGVVWDGTGYGPDSTVWGGEFLIATLTDYQRFAYLRPFPLPGGTKAVREPRLAALGLLYEVGIKPNRTLRDAFTESEYVTFRTMLDQNLNCPPTSSAGRLFDAVAALAGLCTRNRYEGEAAMKLEFALKDKISNECYPCPEGTPLDWVPMIHQLVYNVESGVKHAQISVKFHNTMANLVVAIAQIADRQSVVLTGGCFQNRYLLEQSIRRLRESGFTPLWHRQVPPNDGGLALGQACVAACQIHRA